MTVNEPVPSGLLPSVTHDAENDKNLDLIFGDIVSQITGLARNLCRRRWQEKLPLQPPRDEDWCAVGLMDIEPDVNSYSVFKEDEGLIVSLHETLSVLISFYGLNAMFNAMNLRVGLTLSENRYVLSQKGMAFLSTSNPVRLPELINQSTLMRTDITIKLRRHEKRIYPVHSVLSSDGVISTEFIKQTFTTETIK